MVVKKRAFGDASKNSAQSSSGIAKAKGRNDSRCLTKSLRFSFMYGAQGDASRLRLPSARGPNSAAPWKKATIFPECNSRRVSFIFKSSESSQRYVALQ